MSTHPVINALPDAPSGSVMHLASYSPSTFTSLLPSVATLCRNTAPLVAFAYACIRRKIPCNILGRDIGAGLIALVRKQRATDVSDLARKLDVWLEREVERAANRGKSPEYYYDQHACLQSIMADTDSIDAIVKSIESLFSDVQHPSTLLLSTIHKAKGSEWSTVFLLDWHLIPSRYAELPWQQQQERNLQYVAVTRAKLNLRFITSERWTPNSVTNPIQTQP